MSKYLILVEDKNAGKLIIDFVNNIYFRNSIDVKSFYGLPLLYKYIEDNKSSLCSYSRIIILYDEASGNVSIRNKIDQVHIKLEQSGLRSKTDFISIICFEYVILTAKYINIFAQIECHNLIRKLIYIEANNGKSELFNSTRLDNDFKDLYKRVEAKAKADLSKKGKVDEKLLRNKITFESMCKLLFSDAFKNYLYIDREFGKCWENTCCIKKRRDCNIVGSVNLASVQKKLYLVQYSSYMKLVKSIETLFGINRTSVETVNMDNIISKSIDTEVLMAYDINSKISKNMK